MQLEVYASESLGFVSQTATMVQLIVISPFADSMPGANIGSETSYLGLSMP